MAWAWRQAVAVKLVSVVTIALSLVLVARGLPIGEMIESLSGWVRGLGVWGPVVYGLIYVVAVVALVPASALTLAAGALFGLWVGTITVSLASTTGAALAFLVARYLARDTVARRIRHYPKSEAIDRAIGEGGWKIVAMLRLSPAVPFNLQNYLYGLTKIRFWPCVLTSWLAMFPGTLMYVYLGHVSRAGLEAASGGRSRTPGEWLMIVVGLLATVAVTVYVSRLARRAMREHEGIAGHDEKSRQSGEDDHAPPTLGWPWGATILALLALAAVGGAVFTQVRPDALRGLLAYLGGPPRVTLREAYANEPGGSRFDHRLLDELLKSHVVAGGWVDYRGLSLESGKLDDYLARVAEAPFDKLGRDEKLALLLNAYNAFTLRLILDHYPIDSIRSIPDSQRWAAVRWKVGPHIWSLNQIEHEQIRPKFREPRVHFALVCAAVGCPPLRSEAYAADRLEEQLEDQARYIHSQDRWVRFNSQTDTLALTSLYKWYGSDFVQVAGSIPAYASRYVPAIRTAIEAGRTPNVTWLDYDWSLNSKENLR